MEQGEESQVRPNDLGGWSVICPAHGVVAVYIERVAAKLSALLHDDTHLPPLESGDGT